MGNLFSICREQEAGCQVAPELEKCSPGTGNLEDNMLNVPSSSTSLTAKPTIGRSEYGRVKVALPRGKGLMDWVVLTSNKVLARKRMKYVDHEELSQHNKADDCWIHIFGQVYDVTPYLEFHPGGIPELMRASGRDGTALFNQYHAWVNYENMLKSCFVGQFKGDLSKLKPCDPPTIQNADTHAGGDEDLKKNILLVTSYDRLIVSHPAWKGIRADCVTVSSARNTLRLLVRPFGGDIVQIEWVGVPTPITSAHFSVDTSGEQVIVAFLASISLKVLESPALYRMERNPMPRYHECRVHSVRDISHDTKLFSLQLPKGVHMPIPLGHHVSVSVKKGAATLYREYTPVGGGEGRIELMIKIYLDGLCTPTISKWTEGDTVSISDPIGDWDLSEWTLPSHSLLVLAAGSGWTPMVQVVRKRIDEKSENGNSVHIFYFNKTDDDIVEDSWMPFKWDDSRMRVNHVLSRPSDIYTGSRGRISQELLEQASSDRSSQLVAICGPDGFIQSAVGILSELGYSTDQVHVFQG